MNRHYLIGELAESVNLRNGLSAGPRGVEAREPHQQTQSQHKKQSATIPHPEDYFIKTASWWYFLCVCVREILSSQLFWERGKPIPRPHPAFYEFILQVIKAGDKPGNKARRTLILKGNHFLMLSKVTMTIVQPKAINIVVRTILVPRVEKYLHRRRRTLLARMQIF